MDNQWNFGFDMDSILKTQREPTEPGAVPEPQNKSPSLHVLFADSKSFQAYFQQEKNNIPLQP